MKRVVAICLLLAMIICRITAQFVITNPAGYVRLSDSQYNLDAIILFNGIDFSSEIAYSGTETSIEWVYTIGGVNYNSTQRSISPEDGVLYRLNVNGVVAYHIFTIDYTAHPVTPQNIQVDVTSADECENITLAFDISASELIYQDRTGAARKLPRMLTLDYNDVEWQESQWQDIHRNLTISAPYAPVEIPTPKSNTTFRLSGDQYASQLGIITDTVYADYDTRAIECHAIGTVVEREYKNEKDRKKQTSVEGSGPLVVEFTSNTNPADLVYIEWLVANVERPNAYQRYNDTDLRYTFEDSGEYTVKLSATNNQCTSRDSINVKVISSLLEAPNVFTPNGDGINDEWRVAYRSIERYSCIIQNRWGRTVFRSDNPGKGWDGTINGKPAAEGTYYYSIVAYGTDRDIKGRQMKYRLDGDINLIR